MSLIEAFLLGIIQGLTEFLPVSSSGHLVLLPWWLGWQDPGLAFNAMLHLGTVLAVLAYFWRDWWAMAVALWQRLRGRPAAGGQDRLLLLLVVGTIPAAVIGFLFEDFFESLFASPPAAAGFLIVTGLLLLFAERLHRGDLAISGLRLPDVLVIGFAQALAIAPGISRSGSTIAAGLVRGLDRPAAARFSFLLGTPVILGAGLFKLQDLVQIGMGSAELLPVLSGFLAAVVSGFLSIRYLLRYLQSHSLSVFIVYVWAMAALSLLRWLLI